MSDVYIFGADWKNEGILKLLLAKWQEQDTTRRTLNRRQEPKMVDNCDKKPTSMADCWLLLRDTNAVAIMVLKSFLQKIVFGASRLPQGPSDAPCRV